MLNDLTSKVAEARRLLMSARDRLDAALAAIPGTDQDSVQDSVMATPALLLLLLQTVEAKRELDRVEVLLAAERP